MTVQRAMGMSFLEPVAMPRMGLQTGAAEFDSHGTSITLNWAPWWAAAAVALALASFAANVLASMAEDIRTQTHLATLNAKYIRSIAKVVQQYQRPDRGSQRAHRKGAR